MRRPRDEAARRYAAAAPPPPRTPWRAAGYCVLDLETTGLDPRRDQIVSFAAVPIDDGRIIAAGICEGLVRPTRPIPGDAVRIHGIRPGDVAAAPDLDAALDRLLPALAGRVLVVHVDWVERGFLGRALRRRGVRLHEPVLDTARLAAVRFPDVPEGVALAALNRRLGLPGFREHEALGDALTTAQAFLALATLMDREAPQTVGTLSAAGARAPRPSWRRRPSWWP